MTKLQLTLTALVTGGITAAIVAVDSSPIKVAVAFVLAAALVTVLMRYMGDTETE